MKDARFDTENWIALLKDPNPRVREKAAFGLRMYNPHSVEAILALAEALNDKDLGVSRNAGLGLFSRDAEPALPWLIKNLDHEDVIMRRIVAAALSFIGYPAKEAIPKLEQLQERDPDPLVQTWIKAALRSIRAGELAGSTH
jgi:HEAT repeat protein